MNVLLYLLASLGCGGLAIQNWYQNREYNAAHHFSILAALSAMAFAAFGLNLIFGPTLIRCLYPLIACFIPAALINFLLGWLKIEGSIIPRYFWGISTIMGCLYVLMKIFLYPELSAVTPAEILPILWLGGGGIYGCIFLWSRVIESEETHQQQRLKYLFLLLIGTTLSIIIEAAVRAKAPEIDLSSIGVREKISVMQGAIPPFGAAFATLTLYVLHLNVTLTRLISLQELFARLASKSIASIGLSLLILLSLAMGSGYPLHIAFQTFLICGLFLAIYPGLQGPLDFLTNHLLNRQGSQLNETLVDLERDIVKMIEQKELNEAILRKLHEAGRTELVSLYLWDHDQGLYMLRNCNGVGSPLPAVGQGPFVASFEYGEVRQSVSIKKQANRGIETAASALRVMEQMESELCIPLWADDVVVGWINFKSDPLLGGFSTEETRKLQKLVDKTAVAIETIRSVDQLKEQHRLAALGTMSAGLAHEIRNPLAGIKGAAQYLQDGAEAHEIPAFLHLIISEADRLNVVVSQFLDYARPLNPNREYADINNVMRGAIEVARASYHNAEIYWQTEFDQRLPDIRIDSSLFQHVFLNLFQNAAQSCKFSGQIIVRSKLSKCKTPPHIGQPAIEIQVEDNGQGIPPEVKEKLFIPFYTTKEKGTGLGLAMIQRILEVHEGEIQVFSTPGAGAKFVIRIPILEII